MSFWGSLFIRNPDIDYVYHLFQIPLREFPPVSLSSEHVDYRWVSLEDCQKIPLMKGAKEALEKYSLWKGRKME